MWGSETVTVDLGDSAPCDDWSCSDGWEADASAWVPPMFTSVHSVECSDGTKVVSWVGLSRTTISS